MFLTALFIDWLLLIWVCGFAGIPSFANVWLWCTLSMGLISGTRECKAIGSLPGELVIDECVRSVVEFV